MDFLHKASKVLLVLPILFFLYDVISGWVLDAKFQISSFKEFWGDIEPVSYTLFREKMQPVMGEANFKSFVELPAAVVLLLPSVFSYLLYRIIYLFNRGRGGKFRYKSHD